MRVLLSSNFCIQKLKAAETLYGLLRLEVNLTRSRFSY
jgi:hypothetical protein